MEAMRLTWASVSPAAVNRAIIASSSAAGSPCPARISSQARLPSSWRTVAAGSPAMAAVRPITSRAAATSARFIREWIRISCSRAATAGSVTAAIRPRISVSAA